MKILRYDSPLLRIKSENLTVSEIESEEFKKKLSNMMLIFKEQQRVGGAALAAPQVGWNVRLFAMAWPDPNAVEIFINSRILEKHKKLVRESEGCLSFPGLYISVGRPKTCTWEYTTLETPNLELSTESLSDFFSRLIQHEIDHLDGILFTDRASTVQKLKIKKWHKLHK